MDLITFQDFEQETDRATFIGKAITNHILGPIYRMAHTADFYDHQQNVTINEYVKIIFTLTGMKIADFTASNNKLSSNFFHRLNTQRCTYLLGNGVSFTNNKEMEKNEEGVEITIDKTKETLGDHFDADLKSLGYYALIHGISFGFWNLDKLHVFPVTEFVPLWDEDTGALRAGIRFWKLAPNKPTIAVLYEEDGYTKFRSESKTGENTGYNFREVEAKRGYKVKVQHSEADGDSVVGEENYGSLPIVPMWGSGLKQSTLVGMREKIDSFDLIRSGFANDLTDCAEIYWIIENAGGMDDKDLAKFRDRLKINHIAVVDSEGGSKAVPYTQDIPYQARQTYLDSIRAGIYEDFGALDVHTVAAGATNDHIDAAYQPMDEEADDFEYQVCEFIQKILSLIGIEDVPVFKRNRISNELEQTNMVMMSSQYLDQETILQKLPFISVDEIPNILARTDEESLGRMETEEEEDEDNPFDQE